ncbi:MAG: sensor histidine kinase, partial [Acidimicrobiales bacterium]
DEARTAVAALRPAVLDDLGLAPAVGSLARGLAGVDADVDAELAGACALAAHVEVAVYRIAQEALQNVAKHARASRVEVRLAPHDGGLALVVADDGQGFDMGGPAGARATFGLAGMNERAELIGGRLVVTSSPGEGTTVALWVPTRPMDR